MINANAADSQVRIIVMAVGNVTCIIAAACLAYLPTNRKWSRLVAYWFTSFQVRLRFCTIDIGYTLLFVYSSLSVLCSVS